MHHLDANKTHGEKARCELLQNVTRRFEQILKATRHKNSSCMATYLPSNKLSKEDEQDMLGTAGEVRTNS